MTRSKEFFPGPGNTFILNLKGSTAPKEAESPSFGVLSLEV